MFWAQMAWGAAPEGYVLGTWAVEQYQDCADRWDSKVPVHGDTLERATNPIGLVASGIKNSLKGSKGERKRFGAFTDCYFGALQKRLAENEREAELRKRQLREMCSVHRCDSPEWTQKCNSLIPDDYPPIRCPARSESTPSVATTFRRGPAKQTLYCNEVPADDWSERICIMDHDGTITSRRIGES